MKCKKCGARLVETYSDFSATYIGYVERYVNCWGCKFVNIIRYKYDEIVSIYPMVRDEENLKEEKCYYANKCLPAMAFYNIGPR